MTHKVVLDTSALVAYWRREPGAERVHECLRRGGCVMHEVNVSEICFTLPRKLPERFNRESARVMLEVVGVITVSDFGPKWADAAADIRLKTHALNFGDGIAVALAAHLGIPLMTTEKSFLGAAGSIGFRPLQG